MATPSYDVFISYKSEDLALAEDLHRRLVAEMAERTGTGKALA